jgi:oxygen-independent coproporphyrinogen-3 oxidase
MSQASVYIHIPFCASKCSYCTFNSYAGLDHLHETYTEALQMEMALCAQTLGRQEVSTVYLGGGTPTVVDVELVARLVESCQEHFDVDDDAEISVEANPGTVDGAYLAALRALGVNRLSIGAQSFADQKLALLGRLHTAAETEKTYYLARKAGFRNINLDLIYSLPTQTLDEWKADISAAMALDPDHLSLYSLSIEEGTPLARMISSGELARPDPDLAAEMYIWAEGALANAGYDHYELSNWARSSRECQHNLSYWRNAPYLGFGAGAHSHFAGCRYHNVIRPEEYVALIDRGESCVAGSEEIDAETGMSETMIMGLRLLKGVSRNEFEERFHRPLVDVYGEQLGELADLGLLDVNAKRVRLTPRGRLLGNEVFERFLPCLLD